MYKSPIEIVMEQMRTEQENNIFRAVQDVGVNVDKEELIRALQYDRGQYNKGYKDGLKKGMREFAERVKSFIDMGHLRPPTELCFSELSVVNMIDSLLEEMAGE